MHNNHDQSTQFQPFDSLKGFREYLREKEKKACTKKRIAGR